MEMFEICRKKQQKHFLPNFFWKKNQKKNQKKNKIKQNQKMNKNNQESVYAEMVNLYFKKSKTLEDIESLKNYLMVYALKYLNSNQLKRLSSKITIDEMLDFMLDNLLDPF